MGTYIRWFTGKKKHTHTHNCVIQKARIHWQRTDLQTVGFLKTTSIAKDQDGRSSSNRTFINTYHIKYKRWIWRFLIDYWKWTAFMMTIWTSANDRIIRPYNLQGEFPKEIQTRSGSYPPRSAVIWCIDNNTFSRQISALEPFGPLADICVLVSGCNMKQGIIII